MINWGTVGTSNPVAIGFIEQILVEKDQLTAGTTWHSAGLLWRLRPSDVDIELLNYTRDLVCEL